MFNFQADSHIPEKLPIRQERMYTPPLSSVSGLKLRLATVFHPEDEEFAGPESRSTKRDQKPTHAAAYRAEVKSIC